MNEDPKLSEAELQMQLLRDQLDSATDERRRVERARDALQLSSGER